jgi:hypothetical protein
VYTAWVRLPDDDLMTIRCVRLRLILDIVAPVGERQFVEGAPSFAGQPRLQYLGNTYSTHFRSTFLETAVDEEGTRSCWWSWDWWNSGIRRWFEPVNAHDVMPSNFRNCF